MQHNVEEIWNQATPFGANGTWQTPEASVLTGGRRDAVTLPLECFGPWADWISGHAEGRSVPPDYVAMGLLACAASLIGNARWGQAWEGWKEPTALWPALVGNPSGGKSPGLDASLNLMRTLESEVAEGFTDTLREHERDKESAKYVREQWEGEVKTAVQGGTAAPIMPEGATEPEPPTRPRLSVSDATVEAMGKVLAAHPRGLLFRRDELSGWFGNFDRYGGGGDGAFWTEAYGGREYRIDRVKNKEPIRIPHLTISVVGGIQPEKLSDVLLKSSDDGLAARFLMSWPEPVPPKRPRYIADDRRALGALRSLLDLRMGSDENGNPAPIVIPFAEDAATMFQEWREAHHTETMGHSGLYASFLGKCPGAAIRLACTLEYLAWSMSEERKSESIGMVPVGYALHLIDAYFKPMALRVYGDAALPEAEKGAATVARWIVKTRPDIINARTLRRSVRLPGLTDASKVKAALEVMCDAGWIRYCPTREGDTSGRHQENYTINPACWGEK